jgi:hypothetical protein
MTTPTKAIAPLMLEDYHRVLAERPGSGPVFEKQHIAASLARATAVELEQTVVVSEGFEIAAYYAGHVLGAAMFHIRVGQQQLVYTGGRRGCLLCLLCLTRQLAPVRCGTGCCLLAAAWIWASARACAPGPPLPSHCPATAQPLPNLPVITPSSPRRRLQLCTRPAPRRRLHTPPAPPPAHQRGHVCHHPQGP